MSEAIGMTNVNAYNSNAYNSLAVKLENIKDEQGLLGNAWNGFKELTGLGQSYSKCESMLEKYKNGEIDISQAMEYIDDFKNKQDNMVELEKNILTGTGAIAVSIATSGAAVPSILATGAATGATLKTGLGVLDRATNKVEDDALDSKEVAKDVISGTITGATSAIPSKAFGKLTSGIENNLARDIATKAACSAACGAVSGSVGYLTDVALDEVKQFDFGSLVGATVSSAAVSGTVGAGVGAFQNTGIGQQITTKLASLGNSQNESQIIQDSVTSATRKVAGREVNDAKAVLQGA